MAAYSSIIVWRIPWSEEPGGQQFTGPQSRTRLKRVAQHTHFSIHMPLSLFRCAPS